MKALRFVFQRIFPHRLLIAAAVLLTVLQCGMELWLPRLMAEMVNGGIMQGRLEHVRQLGWRMALLCVAMGLSGYGASIISAFVGQRLALKLRGELYEKINSLSVRQVAGFGQGSLLTRLTIDVDTCAEFVHSLLLLAVEPLLLTLGGIWIMWHEARVLGAAFALFVLLQLLAMLVFIRATAPGFQKVRAATDRLNERMQRVFGYFRLVKAYGTERKERTAFSADNCGLYEKTYAVRKKISVFNPMIMLIVDLTVAAILYLSGGQVARGGMDIGSVLSAITWSEQILLSVAAGGQMFRLVAETQPSASRLLELMETESEMEDGSKSLEGPFRELSFENVSFAYDGDADVLRDLSFRLRAGETLAVIGPVGCGKTTLAGLCVRLYDARKGKILLNGQDIRALKGDELRRSVALVEKQSAILEGTVLDNIVFGRPYVGEEDARRAAAAAQLDGYLEKSPKGMDTYLAARGRSLSGGERQRLSIARALAGKPGLLVLDDSTSSLDYKTEHQLLTALRENNPACGILLITNRLQTALRADHILVLDGEGRCAAEGTDAELRKKSALYNRMIRAQMGEEQDAWDRQEKRQTAAYRP